MRALFFKTKDGELINLSMYMIIYQDDYGDTILANERGYSKRLEQPISDIENFLLKVQEAL
jgi:hypothetical protein